MPEIIISFAGQPGSGKSNLVNNLEKNRGVTAMRPSNDIRDYAASHGIQLVGADRTQWATTRREMNEEFGPDWIATRALHRPERVVAIDGLRTVADFKTLQDADEAGVARVAFMGLFCPIEERFNHLKNGDTNKSRPQSVEELFAQESPEYFSHEGDAGIATQTVLDLTPPELRVDYRHESADDVYQLAVSRLIAFGFLE